MKAPNSTLNRSTKPMKRLAFKVKPLSGILRTARVVSGKQGGKALTIKSRKGRCKLKGCGVQFETFDPMRQWCSVEHGALIAQAKLAQQKERLAKESRTATKAALLDMKPRKWWKAKLKKALHAFIRARDEGESCISCDTILMRLGRLGGDYDAGHFRSVGSAAHLEFEEKNIFGQCKHCNDHLKGNYLEYERRLRILKGDKYVDDLKADQEPRKLSIEAMREMEAYYKAKLKALLKAREATC